MRSLPAVLSSRDCVALIGADLYRSRAPLELSSRGVRDGCQVIGRIRICLFAAGPLIAGLASVPQLAGRQPTAAGLGARASLLNATHEEGSR